MKPVTLQPAALPPAGLPGLDPAWSRLIETPGVDGVGGTWHVLDNGVADAALTLLCVHGNPTWSYLWKDLLASAPSNIRVVAVDHIDMGFSERTGTTRRLAQRIEDLSALTAAMEIDGDVVIVAHDWGGPIALGWAEEHLNQLAGVVLMNTAVHQPSNASAPALIRAVRTPGILDKICVSTPAFVRGAAAFSRPRPPREVRMALEAPYRTPDRRAAIADFVKDIPLDPRHPTAATLDAVANGLVDLGDIPALLLWGPSDPVFSDLYLRDLEQRLPHANVHRFIGASHMLPVDVNIAPVVFDWLKGLDTEKAASFASVSGASLWSNIERLAHDDRVAVVDMGPDGPERAVTFAELADGVSSLASGLASIGLQRGDRVALLVPPGIDLALCLYASWRAGAVVVLVDAGLGARGISRALKSANPDYLIGIPKALSAARTLRWPGTRIATSELSRPVAALTGAKYSLDNLRAIGATSPIPDAPGPDDFAAVAFTSGATGPAKGVVYRHHQIQAQRDALMDLYDIQGTDRLVAAFGPFALFGPSMGITSIVPEMNVTSPGTLTARALAQAVDAVDATLVFGSPAALKNVAATARDLLPAERTALEGVRLLLSAGAPVPADVLRSATAVMVNATAHTPYGMTEVLPVADISLEQIDAAGTGRGVCVGIPVTGVDVLIDPLDTLGAPTGTTTTDPNVLGEVCVRAGHMREGYDKLWSTQHQASQPPGWHRTGDVGHFDSEGRLWIEGRIGHVVKTMFGPVTPIDLEHAINRIADVVQSAIVGVGPIGTQQVVAVIVIRDGSRRSALAKEPMADAVRSAVGDVDIAAVVVSPSLPVDKRHNSKIDRFRIAAWAERVLAGGRMGTP
ncbi:MAG: alpha/beta fold hydrolase [Actinomycetia bacterium]|nr:alpha/beta fold hydrolase [Actinomycetes bacterium]